jgi:hypothetical protein
MSDQLFAVASVNTKRDSTGAARRVLISAASPVLSPSQGLFRIASINTKLNADGIARRVLLF